MGRTCNAEIKNEYNILVGNPERERPLRISRRTWKIILKFIVGK